MHPYEMIDPRLPPMRLVSRSTGEHWGACPLCKGASKRFHVWTNAHGDRPAWRFWCRDCGKSGMVDSVFGGKGTQKKPDVRAFTTVPAPYHRSAPNPEHIPQYRLLYEIVAQWSAQWLFDPSNPTPLRALERRGVAVPTAKRFGLGYALNDYDSLINHVHQVAPDLVPYMVEAGLASETQDKRLITHRNLRGMLVFPTKAHGVVSDICTRPFGGGHALALPGSPPAHRGAVDVFGWDMVGSSTTVILTESGDYKVIVPCQAFVAGKVAYPTIGHPGLNSVPWNIGPRLLARGITTVILAYDAQPRASNENGQHVAAPEEVQAIRTGKLLEHAGIQVRVARLPLAPGQEKQDLDQLVLVEGAAALQRCLDQALTLRDCRQHLTNDPLLASASKYLLKKYM